MDAFKKVVYLGLWKPEHARRSMPVFCEITWTQKEKGMELSIHGSINPNSAGNAYSCGQIDMSLKGHVRRFTALGKGWNYGKIHHFLNLWGEWHLNAMRAGTVAQTQALKVKRLAEPDWNRMGDFKETCAFLESQGLQPDNGYSYGSQWLHEEVPEEVIQWLHALPESERVPAWV